MGADTLNFDASTSSTRKGETAADTLRTLEAMGVHGFGVRHQEVGAVAALAEVAGSGTCLVNASDGSHSSQTQGLLDLLTKRQGKRVAFRRYRTKLVEGTRLLELVNMGGRRPLK